MLETIKRKITKDGLAKFISDGIGWSISLSIIKLKRYVYNIGRKKAINNLNYIEVRPNNIKYMLIENEQTYGDLSDKNVYSKHELEKGSFRPDIEVGYVLSGEWDKYKKSHNYDRIYTSLKEYYEKNTPLTDTSYGEQLNIINIRTNDDKIFKTQNNIDTLYESLVENGFLDPYELGNKYPIDPIYMRPWPITVNIGRNGEIIFNNWQGHHRLAMAKILDVNKVPVMVVIRHSRWEKIRRKVANAYSEQKLPNSVRKYRIHPDIEPLIDRQ